MQELHWGQLEAEIMTELQARLPAPASDTAMPCLWQADSALRVQGLITGPRQHEALLEEISKYRLIHPRLQARLLKAPAACSVSAALLQSPKLVLALQADDPEKLRAQLERFVMSGSPTCGPLANPLSPTCCCSASSERPSDTTAMTKALTAACALCFWQPDI